MTSAVGSDHPQRLDCDVLVIGGGGAALRAAVAAASTGVDVVLVTKGRFGASGATAFGVAETAGFAVPDGKADPDDSPETFYGDVIGNAQGCADGRLAEVLVSEAKDAADYLRGLGVEFMRNPDGEELVAMGDFATRPRNRKIYDHGKPISAALAAEATRLGVRVQQRTTMIDLVMSGGRVVGGTALTRDGSTLLIAASATVLATGGAGQLFTRSLMPPDITGGGYALGLDAGARLVNMEFIQAGFGTVHGGTNMVMTWYWRLRPKLLDSAGTPLPTGGPGVRDDDVMDAKARHYPFSCSDASGHVEIAAKRALVDVVGTSEERLYLDFTEPAGAGDAQEAAFWSLSEDWLRRKGIDVRKEPMQVALFGHSVNGGLVVDAGGQTDVEGLFAAGEVTGGAYGADRLGGNMLLTCQVFGRRAGLSAARLARGRPRVPTPSVDSHTLDWLRGLGHRASAASPFELRRRVKQTMTRGVLVERTEESLLQTLSSTSAIAAALDASDIDVTSPRDALVAHEVRTLCTVGQVVANSALCRRESRGAHYRADHPNTSADFAHPLFVSGRTPALTVDAGRFETDLGR